MDAVPRPAQDAKHGRFRIVVRAEQHLHRALRGMRRAGLRIEGRGGQAEQEEEHRQRGAGTAQCHALRRKEKLRKSASAIRRAR